MYSRSMSIDVEMVQGVGYRATGTFEDWHHHLKTSLLFELGTSKVLEADAVIIRVPFEECKIGVSSIKKLIGLDMNQKGTTRQIFELLAGPGGCTHLAELVVECFKARIQAFGKERPDWVDPDLLDRAFRAYELNFANTCIHFTPPYWKPHQE